MTLTAEELLTKIKQGLGITGNYQDETLKFYIDEVKSYLISAGVSAEVCESSEAVGAIMRGVADLWNYGSGTIKLSEYFIQRLIQLSSSVKDDCEGGNTNVPTN